MPHSPLPLLRFQDGTDAWYRNIVLAGGSTCFPGLAESLEFELQLWAPKGAQPQVCVGGVVARLHEALATVVPPKLEAPPVTGNLTSGAQVCCVAWRFHLRLARRDGSDVDHQGGV